MGEPSGAALLIAFPFRAFPVETGLFTFLNFQISSLHRSTPPTALILIYKFRALVHHITNLVLRCVHSNPKQLLGLKSDWLIWQRSPGTSTWPSQALLLSFTIPMTLEDTTIDVTQSCTGSDRTHQPQIGSIYVCKFY